MREVVVAYQFRGPPNSGNGGYVCGLIGKEVAGPATVTLRALIPLDTPLDLDIGKQSVRLVARDGTLIAEATRATSDLPEPPIAPTLEQARAAGSRCPVIEKPFHPPCFTCSSIREEGDGLRILPGQVEGAAEGVIACVWTPNPAFARPDGLIPAEIVWASLDCPGSLAWIVKSGMGGGTPRDDDSRSHNSAARRPADDCDRMANRAEWPQVHRGSRPLRRTWSGDGNRSADLDLARAGVEVLDLGRDICGLIELGRSECVCGMLRRRQIVAR